MEKQRFIRTKTVAEQVGCKPASIRTAVWRKGHYCGVVPIKAPNGQLLWPADTSDRITAKAV